MEWNIPFFDGFWFHVSHLFHLSQFWLCTIRNFWTWLFYGFWWWKGGCLNITHIILRTYFLRLVAYVCCMDDMQESEANHFHFPSHLSLWKCWRNIRNWLSCIWMTFEELSCWTLACFPLQCRRAACASPNYTLRDSPTTPVDSHGISLFSIGQFATAPATHSK